MPLSRLCGLDLNLEFGHRCGWREGHEATPDDADSTVWHVGLPSKYP